MWSGCMWVTITRSTGRPRVRWQRPAPTPARVASLAMPQSTMVQPSRAVVRSRSSHRLMWSSAKGSAMRSQRTPGATSSVVPGAGSARRAGSASALSCGLAMDCLASYIYVYVNVSLTMADTSRQSAAHLHHHRAGRRVRHHRARHPLLRGRGPAHAAARRPQPRLHPARPHAPEAHAARQAPGPEPAGDQAAGDDVRLAFGHRAAAGRLPGRAGQEHRKLLEQQREDIEITLAEIAQHEERCRIAAGRAGKARAARRPSASIAG